MNSRKLPRKGAKRFHGVARADRPNTPISADQRLDLHQPTSVVGMVFGDLENTGVAANSWELKNGAVRRCFCQAKV